MQKEEPEEEINTGIDQEERCNQLVSKLLEMKRKLIEELKSPQESEQVTKNEPEKPKEIPKKKKKKDIMDNILDDGGFVISEEEKESDEDDEQEQRKSVSTNASLNNALLDFNYEEKMYNQSVFSSSKSKIFCEEVSDLLTKFQKLITGNTILMNSNIDEGTSTSFKIDEDLLTFLYNYLVVNKIEYAEIEIFFAFFTNLVDVKI